MGATQNFKLYRVPEWGKDNKISIQTLGGKKWVDFKGDRYVPINESNIELIIKSVIGKSIEHHANNFADLRKEIDALEKDIMELKEELDLKPVVKNITLYDIGIEDYHLNAPLNITIEEYKDEVIAKYSEVEVWGSGATDSEAILDFKVQLVAVFEDLIGFEKEKTLGKLPNMWLRILKKFISKDI